MRNKSALTYAGALAMLGKHDRPTLDAVQRMLNTGKLVTTVILPPAAAVADLIVEAVGHTRAVADRVGGRIAGTSGRERQDLITAAHTVIVLSSFLDSLQESFGVLFDEVALADDELVRLARPRRGDPDETKLLDRILGVEMPLPSAHSGYDANAERELRPRLGRLSQEVLQFVQGLAVWPSLTKAGLMPSDFHEQIVERSMRIYKDRYLTLTVDAPEFFIWATFMEHGSTRTEIRVLEHRLTRTLVGQSEALGKMRELLELTVAGNRPYRTSYSGKLAKSAEAVLAKSLLRSTTLPPEINVPSVREGFITPSFRVAIACEGAPASVEDWWAEAPVREGLDGFLAAHLSHPEAAELPIIVMGHPGSGKSLLMEVLAAQLPDRAFTVVPVHLRRVNATDRLLNQIENGLRDALNEEVPWGRFSDACAETTRVVILDGFDELVQASGVMQTNYFSYIQEFQEREHDLGRSVVVIITSRTLVVDRARIPDGCVLIKIERFDDVQVNEWVSAWNRANWPNTYFPKLQAQELLDETELCRQPLLLMMLAIYAAGNQQAVLRAEGLSRATLYRQLMDAFILRQAVEKSERPPVGADLARALEAQRWRLSLTAFAMFNRGRQQAMDLELERDFDALVGPVNALPPGSFDTPINRTHRTIAAFFFLHVATIDAHSETSARRAYEFLHATFIEYLIAERTLRLITGYVKTQQLFTSDPASCSRPDDGMLRALLSHETLLRQRPIIDFLQESFDELDADERSRHLAAIDSILANIRSRVVLQFERYQPKPVDVVSELAVYSANVVLLRVLFNNGPLPLSQLGGQLAEPVSWWRSTVRLWVAGLSPETCSTVLTSFEYTEPTPDEPHLSMAGAADLEGRRHEPADVGLARLLGL